MVVLILLAIYCFGTGEATKSLFYSDSKIFQSSDQKEYLSAVSTALFCHTPLSESSINSVKSFPAQSFKKLFSELWAITIATEFLTKTVFSQYTCIARNFLIRYRNAAVIFPFHYFW